MVQGIGHGIARQNNQMILWHHFFVITEHKIADNSYEQKKGKKEARTQTVMTPSAVAETVGTAATAEKRLKIATQLLHRRAKSTYIASNLGFFAPMTMTMPTEESQTCQMEEKVTLEEVDG